MQSLRLLRVLALVALAVGVTVIAPHSTAAADQDVVPALGAPGATFSFFALGFTPDEQVSFWTNDPSGHPLGDPHNRATASKDGRADWSWTAPGDAALGTWSMVAYGGTSGVQHVIPFTIASTGTAPNPNENLPILASPQVGSAGTTFAFYATGFEDREVVGFWATTPDHRVIGSNAFRVMSNRQGRADWTWTVPEGVPTGTWLMTAKGESSFVQRSITIEIR